MELCPKKKLASELKGSLANKRFQESKSKIGGLQFIAVQATPEEQRFAGFWMLKDLIIQ